MSKGRIINKVLSILVNQPDQISAADNKQVCREKIFPYVVYATHIPITYRKQEDTLLSSLFYFTWES